MFMRSLLALALLALIATPVAGQDPDAVPNPDSPARLETGLVPVEAIYDSCCPEHQQYFLFPENGFLDIRGWMDIGFMLNGENPPSQFHGPYNQVDRDEAMVNQVYLIAEHGLDCCEGIDVGGRVDVLYGTDFFLAQSDGFERRSNGAGKWNSEYYGLAIPQLYGEIGNQTLSAKIGHFYSIIGYEAVPAPNNFFYSKSYSYQFAGPFTHWGGLAIWNPNQNVTVEAGLVNGRDALDRIGNRVSFMGRATVRDCHDAWYVQFGVITGDEETFDGRSLTNHSRYTLIGSLQVTDEIQYVVHHFLGRQSDEFGQGQSAEWYGLNQYLYYQVNCDVKLGARFEWFRDDDGVRVGLNRPSNPNKPPFVGHFYSLTLGVNWTPVSNVTLRPEVRWDWFDGSGLPFDDGRDDSQFTIGMDAIVLF